jgi:hypothetical protein
MHGSGGLRRLVVAFDGRPQRPTRSSKLLGLYSFLGLFLLLFQLECWRYIPMEWTDAGVVKLHFRGRPIPGNGDCVEQLQRPCLEDKPEASLHYSPLG